MQEAGRGAGFSVFAARDRNETSLAAATTGDLLFASAILTSGCPRTISTKISRSIAISPAVTPLDLRVSSAHDAASRPYPAELRLGRGDPGARSPGPGSPTGVRPHAYGAEARPRGLGLGGPRNPGTRRCHCRADRPRAWLRHS